MPADMGARRRVVLVTSQWGDGDDEARTTTRLIAGALARRAEVSVIALVTPPEEPTVLAESVFDVHRLPIHGARPLRSALVRSALGAHDGGRHVPAAAAELLDAYEGNAPDVVARIESLEPDALVLVGPHQPWDLEALTRASPGLRITLVPFLADPVRLSSASFRRLVAAADVIAAVHPGERRAVLEAYPERDASSVVPLDVAFSLNRSATRQQLFGIRFFSPYVLLLRQFPPDGPRYEHAITHEVLRNVVDKISVAEVDAAKWRVSDAENTLEFPVNPSRVNLWRLMAHAEMTIDVRPPGPVGREAIESMLLASPVVVPEHSAAMEHAAAASGGLWYADTGELFDAVRALMYTPLRHQLAEQGSDWARATHGRVDEFVERTESLVLGSASA